MLVPRPDSRSPDRVRDRAFRGNGGPGRILDLGTGPGTLLLAALDIWPEATGIGIDLSRQAPDLCFGKRSTPRVRGAAEVDSGDWADGLAETFDLILCNPPYIADGAELGPGVAKYEPDEALFAGREGLDAYRELAPQLPRLLAKGGLAAIEIGAGSRRGRSPTLLAREGWTRASRMTLPGALARSC